MADTGSETTKATAAAQTSAAPSQAKPVVAKGRAPAKAASVKSGPKSDAATAAKPEAPAPEKTSRTSAPRAKKAASSAKASGGLKSSGDEATKPGKSTDTSKNSGSKSASPTRASASRSKLKEQIAKSVPTRAVGAGRPARAAARRAVSPSVTSAAQMRRVAKAAPADKPATTIDAVTESSVKAAEAVSTTVAASVDAAVKTVKDGKAKPSLSTPAMPQPPEFALLTGSAVMTQTLSMARAFGTLQAKMLDHACAEFNATLSEAEKLSRTASAADAVALQAKAVRRSFQSYADHLKELARVASDLAKKG